jgi:hypothetical protein
MGKLDISRMQNATRLNKVDDAHVALEGDLEEIFAIPDNTDIDPPIFEGVNEKGKISGVVRLYQASASSTPANCIGFQFEDGTEIKRLVFVESKLRLFKWEDPNWTEISNLESPGSGKIVDLTDVDIEDDEMAEKIGYLLHVNDEGNAFELVEGASGDGINTFAELTDCFDPADKVAGEFVIVNEAADGLTTAEAPDGLGDPYVAWIHAPYGTDDDDVFTWDVSGYGEDGSGGNPWHPPWQWQNVLGLDPGNFLTQLEFENNLDPARNDLYITLPAGVYDVSVWYECTSPLPYGVREWRIRSVIEFNANGPATFGASNPAAVVLTAASNPQAKAGFHFLGTRQLFLTLDDDIWMEIHQTAGAGLDGCKLTASISRIK